MLNINVFEGKTREEALEKAMDYYNLDEEYLYIIDSIDLGKISFERTKLISPNKRWEKVIDYL